MTTGTAPAPALSDETAIEIVKLNKWNGTIHVKRDI